MFDQPYEFGRTTVGDRCRTAFHESDRFLVWLKPFADAPFHVCHGDFNFLESMNGQG
jgi:hypothetical protein